MVRKRMGLLEGYLSRRDVLRCMAGCMMAVSLESCAQGLSSSSTPTPIPTPRRPGSILYTYRGHKERILTVAWSPNGKYIASGSLDKTVHLGYQPERTFSTLCLPRTDCWCANGDMVTGQSSRCFGFLR